jgi:hypothetical protein
VSKTLHDLTKAYLAVDGLLKSPLISFSTRRSLQVFLVELDQDIVRLMKAEIKDHPTRDEAAD